MCQWARSASRLYSTFCFSSQLNKWVPVTKHSRLPCDPFHAEGSSNTPSCFITELLLWAASEIAVKRRLRGPFAVRVRFLPDLTLPYLPHPPREVNDLTPGVRNSDRVVSGQSGMSGNFFFWVGGGAPPLRAQNPSHISDQNNFRLFFFQMFFPQ